MQANSALINSALIKGDVLTAPETWVTEETSMLGNSVATLGNTIAENAAPHLQKIETLAQDAWVNVKIALSPESLRSFAYSTISITKQQAARIGPCIQTVLNKLYNLWLSALSYFKEQSSTFELSGMTQKFISIPPGWQNTASSYYDIALAKVQEAWTQILPYLHAFGEFLRSDLGISLVLLTTGICFLKLSQNVESRIASISYFVLGVGTIMTSGILLVNSGFLTNGALSLGRLRIAVV